MSEGDVVVEITLTDAAFETLFEEDPDTLDITDFRDIQVRDGVWLRAYTE